MPVDVQHSPPRRRILRLLTGRRRPRQTPDVPPLGLWILLGGLCWLLSVLVLWLVMFVLHDHAGKFPYAGPAPGQPAALKPGEAASR